MKFKIKINKWKQDFQLIQIIIKINKKINIWINIQIIDKKIFIKTHNKIFNILQINKNKLWKIFQKIKKYTLKNFKKINKITQIKVKSINIDKTKIKMITLINTLISTQKSNLNEMIKLKEN